MELEPVLNRFDDRIKDGGTVTNTPPALLSNGTSAAATSAIAVAVVATATKAAATTAEEPVLNRFDDQIK